MYEYRAKGTCSRRIRFEIRDGKLHDLTFDGGCDGNAKSIGRLVEGMDAREVSLRLAGINCMGRGTSCGDQLAHAIAGALDGSLPEKA